MTPEQVGPFRELVLSRGRELYRDLPWRRTRNPYNIWISEVMLQQTQVVRVDGRWQRWLERFPTPAALAAAPVPDVLEEWQGLGYNRRALAVQKAAQQVVELYGGEMPRGYKELVALPGIGPATAAGIRAFAFSEPGVYLETNVRTVFLHELHPGEEGVSDKVLVPEVEAACPADDPRTWYYALLDYGAWLKKTVPNPSRRSKSHARQSKFEGSRRQKRAELVRIVLAAGPEGIAAPAAADALTAVELSSGRPAVDVGFVTELLEELANEGFCKVDGGVYVCG
jgi:A/G-specific adenine glycosylase